jgi:methylphosphotriester-DNA--protein-cysteine methyltransferase
VQKIVCAAKFAKITLRKLKAIEPSRTLTDQNAPERRGVGGGGGLESLPLLSAFKQATSMSPAVCDAVANGPQRLIRETSRNFIEIALEVGYTNPSHFAQVFRPVVGVTPTEFRHAL